MNTAVKVLKIVNNALPFYKNTSFSLSLNIKIFSAFEPKITIKLFSSAKEIALSESQKNILKYLLMSYFCIKHNKSGTEQCISHRQCKRYFKKQYYDMNTQKFQVFKIQPCIIFQSNLNFSDSKPQYSYKLILIQKRLQRASNILQNYSRRKKHPCTLN